MGIEGNIATTITTVLIIAIRGAFAMSQGCVEHSTYLDCFI